MSSKKPKLGTIVKEITEAVGITPCAKCEERQFTMDKWTHKKPICKVDCKDCNEWNNPTTANKTAELYLKYFGLDNTNSTNENVFKVMESDLNKLFNS